MTQVSKSVIEEDIRDLENRCTSVLPSLLNKYDPKDILNSDEERLFIFHLTPGQDMPTKLTTIMRA
jgi:hypothetical protein